MINSALPPGLILVLGCLFIPVFSGYGRKIVMMILPIITLYFIWSVPDGSQFTLPFLDYELEPLVGDKLSRLFATTFTIAAFIGGLFALKQKNTVELIAAYAYAGGAIGVAMAGDLITVFIFWELMAIASTLVIWSAHTDQSYKASMRYITIHLLGGVILMIGIIGHVHSVNSIAFTAMQTDSLWTWMIFIGFLINAGAPPLTSWIPDAYPSASWSGTVFLSAFTTKTAVYVLIRGFPGEDLLIYIGLLMVFYGIIYALLENDIRRIMAYSIVNQVGYMLIGIGIGTELALNGASAQAFAHIIYKALLLMCAGAIIYEINKSKLTELGGLRKAMPFTMICMIIGAMTIAGLPLTSGFTTKTMITTAAADGDMAMIWYLLEAASAGSFLYIGIRVPWLLFFEHKPDYMEKEHKLKPKDPPLNMKWAIGITAAICLILGVFPQPLYALLPYETSYTALKAYKIVQMLQLLLFAGLAFFIMKKFIKAAPSMITLDVDWVYRKLLYNIYEKGIIGIGAPLYESFKTNTVQNLNNLISLVFRHHGPKGALARTWTIGNMVLWVGILLGVFLIVYYI